MNTKNQNGGKALLKSPLFGSNIGIDINEYGVNLAKLNKHRSGITCKKVTEVPVDQSKSLYDEKLLLDLLTTGLSNLGVKKCNAYISINVKDIFIRKIVLPFVKDKEITTALEFELEANSLLPWHVDETVYDWFIDNQANDRTVIVVFAVHKDNIMPIAMACQKIGVNLSGIEIEPLSTLRVLQHSYLYMTSIETKSIDMLVNLNNTTINITFSKNGKYLLSRILNISTNLDLQAGFSDRLSREVKTSLDYLHSIDAMSENSVKIRCIGKNSDLNSEIYECFSKKMFKEVTYLNPFEYIYSNLEENLKSSSYTPAIGAALKRWF